MVCALGKNEEKVENLVSNAFEVSSMPLLKNELLYSDGLVISLKKKGLIH